MTAAGVRLAPPCAPVRPAGTLLGHGLQLRRFVAGSVENLMAAFNTAEANLNRSR